MYNNIHIAFTSALAINLIGIRRICTQDNSVILSSPYLSFKRCVSGSSSFSFQVKDCYAVNFTFYDGLYNPSYLLTFDFQTPGYTEFSGYDMKTWNISTGGGFGIGACEQFLHLTLSWLPDSVKFKIDNRGFSIGHRAYARTNQLLYLGISSTSLGPGILTYNIHYTGPTITNLYNTLFDKHKLMCPISECNYLRDSTLTKCQLNYASITPVCRSGNVYMSSGFCTALQGTCQEAKLTIFGCFAPDNINTCNRCDVLDISDKIATMCETNPELTEIRVSTVDRCDLFTNNWSTYFFISFTEGKARETSTTISSLNTILTTTKMPTILNNKTTNGPITDATTIIDKTTTEIFSLTSRLNTHFPSTKTTCNTTKIVPTVTYPVTYVQTTVSTNESIFTISIIVVVIVLAFIITTLVIVWCAKRRCKQKNRENERLETNSYVNEISTVDMQNHYIPLHHRHDNHEYDPLRLQTDDGEERAESIVSNSNHTTERSQTYTQLEPRSDSHRYDIIAQQLQQQLNRNRVYDYVDANFENSETRTPMFSNTSGQKTAHEYLELYQ